MRVINVPVTLGSNVGRKQGRYKELTGACNYLGFELLQIRENALDNINRSSRSSKEENVKKMWKQAVAQLTAILAANSPKVIFFPHDSDANTTHAGTNSLVME